MAIVLAIAVVFGGGGAPAPMVDLGVQLATLLAMAVWVCWPGGVSRVMPDRMLLLFVAAWIVLCGVQLLPLPPAVWHRLPGRDIEIQALTLVGQRDSWRAWSMTPDRTLTVLLSLTPPAFVAFATAQLGIRERSLLLLVLLVLCCAAGFVGILQVIYDGPAWLTFYPNTAGGFATGFNANRNSSADLLLVGVLAWGATAAAGRHLLDGWGARALAATILAFLCFSLVLTGSRAGLLLLPIALVFAAAMIWPNARPGALSAASVVIGLVALLAAGYVGRDNVVLQRTFTRFQMSREGRLSDLWPDALHATRVYWPVGAGFGAFVPVFEAAERLDVVDPAAPNRAHNDYIELAIEAGFPGLALLAASAIGFLLRVRGLLTRSRAALRRPHIVFALGMATTLACHSFVDYPMRALSLATIAGLGLGLIAGDARRRAPTGSVLR